MWKSLQDWDRQKIYCVTRLPTQTLILRRKEFIFDRRLFDFLFDLKKSGFKQIRLVQNIIIIGSPWNSVRRRFYRSGLARKVSQKTGWWNYVSSSVVENYSAFYSASRKSALETAISRIRRYNHDLSITALREHVAGLWSMPCRIPQRNSAPAWHGISAHCIDSCCEQFRSYLGPMPSSHRLKRSLLMQSSDPSKGTLWSFGGGPRNQRGMPISSIFVRFDCLSLTLCLFGQFLMAFQDITFSGYNYFRK